MSAAQPLQKASFYSVPRMLRPRNSRRCWRKSRASSRIWSRWSPSTGRCQAYSSIRYDLKVKGRLLPDNVLWIAATAVANDYVLVSHDEGFRHVTGLKLEDWLEE